MVRPFGLAGVCMAIVRGWPFVVATLLF
eukprot:SAG11_NODE_14137_length_623_cov_4.717557_1_plen_27_part_10